MSAGKRFSPERTTAAAATSVPPPPRAHDPPAVTLPTALYRAEQVREIDRTVIHDHGIPGRTLMERAGRAAFDHLMQRHSEHRRMVVVCGAGNNGGDGYVVARHAHRIGLAVTVLARAAPKGGDSAAVARAYRDRGGALTDDAAVLGAADVVVDALFGTGLTHPPQDAAAHLIEAMNAAGCPIVSLDMPSGLDSDSGAAAGACVVATTTVTFIALKFGLFTARGRDCAGEILFADLGIPEAARRAVAPLAHRMTAPRLPRRARDAHKGTAGHVLVVGGSRGMLGAALLAAEAAMRCGAGRTTVAVEPAQLDLPALARPELMSADAMEIPMEGVADAVVLGPGLGYTARSERVFERFIAAQTPMVVDADALGWLAQHPRRGHWVLTPHPGEAARLLGCHTAEIQADRAAAAHAIVARYGGVCVLKGVGTIVADDNGAAWLCDRGNAGMATAGMGDVLGGIIGALMGQGLGATAAATASVWLHASAADTAAARLGERGLLAGDVIDALAPQVNAVEMGRRA